MLSIRNVNYAYRDKLVLKDINLEVKKGDFLAIIGPNGSGKTTLIKLITDTLKLKEGSILSDSKRVDSKDVKKSIIYLPSEDILPNFLTGMEYIKLFSKFYDKKVDVSKVGFISKKLHIFEHLDSLIESYSHGMKKKIQILTSLLINPKLIIIDETFNGIDLESNEAIKNLLEIYNKNGGTVIICSHDIELIESMSKRIIVLYEGVIKEDHINKENDDIVELFKKNINFEEITDDQYTHSLFI